MILVGCTDVLEKPAAYINMGVIIYGINVILLTLLKRVG
jgi:hypothetical protein